jgi:hypothetical protein
MSVECDRAQHRIDTVNGGNGERRALQRVTAVFNEGEQSPCY